MNNHPPEELLELLAPDPAAIFNRLRPLISDRMLEVIAGADYGNEAEEHLKELKPIRDNGAVPAPVRWHPKEVLELTRWLMPENEDPRWKTGLSIRENHLIRLFSCATLLRLAAEPENHGYFDGESPTIAPLVHSAIVLGEDLQKDSLALLAWLLKRDRELYEDAPFFGLGCLLLAAHTGAPASTVSGLAAWVVEQEARLRSAKAGRKFGPWLLGLSFHSERNQLWLELLAARGGRLQPGVEPVLADLLNRAAAPWEDYFVPSELLARGTRVGNVRLWALPVTRLKWPAGWAKKSSICGLCCSSRRRVPVGGKLPARISTAKYPAKWAQEKSGRITGNRRSVSPLYSASAWKPHRSFA